MSKFFKDKKISQACSACLHQIAQEIMLLLVNNLMKNVSQKVKMDKILAVPALFVIRT